MLEMETVYFLARYTPFWSIPIFMIAAEFTYVFWVRKRRKITIFCFLLALFTLLCTVGYYFVGGPEKAVQEIIQLHWFFTR